jgi:hypothetical protein
VPAEPASQIRFRGLGEASATARLPEITPNSVKSAADHP